MLSNPSWLDRLHSKSSTTPNPNPNPSPPPLPTASDVLATILSDLFIIAAPRPPPPPTKSLPKQRRPTRIPVAAASASGGGDNSEAGRGSGIRDRKRAAAGGAGDVDLAGYSRTDVTVIDTSLGVWKVERVIFRKGKVWKVRDKKVRVGWRKMRRLVGQKGTEDDQKRSPSHMIDAPPVETKDHAQIQIRSKFSRSPLVPATRD